MIIRICTHCHEVHVLSHKLDTWSFPLHKHLELVLAWEEETSRHLELCGIRERVEGVISGAR